MFQKMLGDDFSPGYLTMIYLFFHYSPGKLDR